MTTKMDSDLLDFVSGTTTVTPNTNTSSTTTTLEPLPKKKVTSKNVSISDLTSILADKTGFSGLKKRMGHLQNSLLRAHEDGTRTLEGVDALTAASNTYDATTTTTTTNTLTADLGNTRKIPILADPLQPVEAKRLQRESALQLATSEANRWIPVIRGNRKSKHLHFSSTPKKERDEGMAVQNCEQLVSTTTATTFTDNSLENEIQSLLHKNEMTSMHSMLAQEESEIKNASTTAEAAEERYKELAKRRSLMFFEEKKRSAQKKIKSKSFRRQLKKERIKKIEKSITPLSTLTAEEREEMRLKAGMDRIRERMTLRTRKADKWAHDRLSSSSVRGGNSLRDGVLEQLRDKARLREEIMGGADDFSSSDDDDVVEEEEEEDVPSELDRISSEGNSSSGDADDDDDKGGIGEIFKKNQKREDLSSSSSASQSLIAKRSYGSIDTVDSVDSECAVRNVKPNTENSDSEDEDYNNNNNTDNKVTLSKNDEQQRLIREAFSADSNSIFHSKSWEERKEEILAQEQKERLEAVAAAAGEGSDAFVIAASTSDLPGFGGKWSGSGIVATATTTKTTKTTQQRGPKVLNSLKRANGSGAAHVIIHQRLPSLTKGRLLCQGAPHNYPGGSEQYESDMAGKRIGKEWNRQKSHSERIRARVTVSSGSIVDPIRFQKKINNNNNNNNK